MVYVIVLFFIIICIIFYDLRNLKNGWVCYYTLMFIFILVAGLRYRVGGDSLAYADKFVYCPTLIDLSINNMLEGIYEPAWYLLNSFAKTVCNDFVVFQIFHAIIINVSVFYIVKKYTQYKFSAILLYALFGYTDYNMEVLRESLALCVFLCSISCFLQKEWGKYFLFVGFALLFHLSAIILLFIPFCYFIPKKISILKFIILLVCIGGILSSINVTYFIEQFMPFDKLLNKASSYIGFTSNLNAFLMRLIKLFPIILLLYVQRRNKLDLLGFEIFVYAYCCISVFAIFIPFFIRFSNYLNIPICLYVVNIFYNIYRSYKIKQLSFLFCSMALGGMLLLNFWYPMTLDMSKYFPQGKYYHLYLPYNSIFDRQRNERREAIFYNSMLDVWEK